MPNRFALLSLAIGAASIVVGSALIFHPLGFIVGGTFLLFAGLSASKRS